MEHVTKYVLYSNKLEAQHAFMNLYLFVTYLAFWLMYFGGWGVRYQRNDGCHPSCYSRVGNSCGINIVDLRYSLGNVYLPHQLEEQYYYQPNVNSLFAITRRILNQYLLLQASSIPQLFVLFNWNTIAITMVVQN